MTAAERDILVSRVVDGVADERDWKALDELSGADAGIWRELAQAQRQHAALISAVEDSLACADGVALPNPAAHQFSARIGQAARWGGWAAAAAVAIAWMGGVRPPAQPGYMNQGNQASVVPFASAADALNAYIKKGQEEGRVISEVPDRLMIQAVPLADGKYEVYFVRQIFEKERINLY